MLTLNSLAIHHCLLRFLPKNPLPIYLMHKQLVQLLHGHDDSVHFIFREITHMHGESKQNTIREKKLLQIRLVLGRIQYVGLNFGIFVGFRLVS